MRNLSARGVAIAFVRHAAALQCLQLAVFGDQALRFAQLEYFDAFSQQMGYFLAVGGHLVDGAAIDQADFAI